MAAAAVSAADAACVARVPAVLEGLLVCDDAVMASSLRKICNMLAGELMAPAHPAATAALLSEGLIPTLLWMCTRTRGPTTQAVYASHAGNFH